MGRPFLGLPIFYLRPAWFNHSVMIKPRVWGNDHPLNSFNKYFKTIILCKMTMFAARMGKIRIHFLILRSNFF